jgi:hypothetical protein
MIVRSESTTAPTPLVVVAAAKAFGQFEHVAPRVAEEREPGANVLDLEGRVDDVNAASAKLVRVSSTLSTDRHRWLSPFTASEASTSP